MSLIDFLQKNGIEYQPAKISVFTNSKGKKVKAPVKYKEINAKPKNIDFSGGMDKELNKKEQELGISI